MDSDFLKGINKAIDAAEGRTGTEYQYKYHTDTTEALDRLAEAIAAGGGGGGGAEIDDNVISSSKTWSSSKINTEIQNNLILDVTNIGV